MRILLVRPWSESVAPVRAALHAYGIAATVTRVDFEAPLDAALERGGFDAIVFDPASGVSRATLDARMLARRCTYPVVEWTTPEALPAALEAALASRRD